LRRIFLTLLLAAAALSAEAGNFRIGAFYRNDAALADYYYDFERTVPGGGAAVAWDFFGPLGAEFAVAAEVAEREPYVPVPPTHLFPDRRLFLPFTAALTSATEVGPATVYVLAGGGFYVERYGFAETEVEAAYESGPLGVWGAGIRARLPGGFYVEFSPRYLHLGGRELTSVEAGDDRHYSDGHADQITLSLGGGFSL
jgi:hypothetical protein